MSDVVNLGGGKFKGESPSTPLEVNENIVEALQELLKLAKEGIVVEICCNTVMYDGGVSKCLIGANPIDWQLTYGALTDMSLRYRDWMLGYEEKK